MNSFGFVSTSHVKSRLDIIPIIVFLRCIYVKHIFAKLYSNIFHAYITFFIGGQAGNLMPFKYLELQFQSQEKLSVVWDLGISNLKHLEGTR